MGNITKEIEAKHTPKGTCVVSFSIATNRVFTSETGEKREEVTFIDCEAFGRVAEVINEYCKKGKPIFIEGRLKLDSWDDKTTGAKRSKMKVIVDTMQLLGSRDSESSEKPKQEPARPAQKPVDPLDPDKDRDDIPF